MMGMRTTARFISRRFLSGARNMSNKANAGNLRLGTGAGAGARNFGSDAESHNIHEEVQQLSRRLEKLEKAIPKETAEAAKSNEPEIAELLFKDLFIGYTVTGIFLYTFVDSDGYIRLTNWKLFGKKPKAASSPKQVAEQ